MKAYNRIFLILLMSVSFGILNVSAQGVEKSWFDANGEISSSLPTSYEMTDLSPIEFQAPTSDDVRWSKDVYRVIDLREKINYPLYYPEIPTNNRESLFSIMFKLFQAGKIPAFKFDIDREVFSKDNLITLDETFLKTYDIIYKAKTVDGKQVFEIEESDIPNRQIVKYYLKETWFFDKHSSTFSSKIISICPVIVVDKGMGNQSFPMFWVPYDLLRPFLVQREVLITNKNNTARMSFDDLFIKRRFSGNIYKESNEQNRILLDMYNNADDVNRRQNEIKTEIINVEEDLWEY